MPVNTGDVRVIPISIVSTKVFGLYEIDDGATSLTTIVTSIESLPPVLVATTV